MSRANSQPLRVPGPHDSTRGSAAVFAALLLGLAATSSQCRAGDAESKTDRGKRTFDTAASFTFENDLFFNTDKYYTDGVQLLIKQRNVDESGPPAWFAKAACLGVQCESDRVELVRHKFGQLMYTPVRITVAEPQPFDRPWAGMLYYTREYEFVSPSRESRTTLSGTVGVIGPRSLAEQTQKWIHRTFTGATPRGWDNQIRGELGLMALVERRHAVPALSTSNTEGVQLKTTGSMRGALGNIMTFVGIGGTIGVGKDLEPAAERVDNISTKVFKPPDLVVQSVDDTRQAPVSRTCLLSWLECSAYAAVELRWMIRNVFLDGTMFRSGPRIEKKPLVADITVGVRVDFPRTRNELTGPWYVSFAATRRSPEFYGRRGSADPQSFGALSIGTEF